MKRKQVVINLIWIFCVLLGCLIASVQAAGNTVDPIQQLVKAKPAIKVVGYSAIFEGRGDGVHICPVTGEKITNKHFKAEHFGRTVYFCCAGCLKSAQRQPDRFIKPTLAEQEQAVKTHIAKATSAPDGSEFCNE